MKKPKISWWRVFILAVPLLALGLFLSTRTPVLMQGSTYSRSPSGYGAWYAYMEKQGIEVKRWQSPWEELSKSPPPLQGEEISWKPQNNSERNSLPMTLLRVANGQGAAALPDDEWVRQGNVVVLLGVRAPSSRHPFSTSFSTPVGAVKIETSRRHREKVPASDVLLEDAAGVVVWEQAIGRGKEIFVVTSHLAANAYQDEPGNFKFLEKLVTEPGNPIWVDEYLHGFRDQKAIAKEKSGSLIGYLTRTPFLIFVMQALIILLVLIWEKNQRLGKPVKLSPPKVDNSAAYIQALAGVLQKADCSGFVLETVGKAELAYVQRSLGLGVDPVEPQTLTDAWVQQTGRPAAELEEVLSKPTNLRPNPQELLTWLAKVQTIHRQLGNP
jgi:Domain of unknown function (DUF4350)